MNFNSITRPLSHLVFIALVGFAVVMVTYAAVSTF